MKKSLAIYGPYPPPLGGMSVHIKRMEPFLIKEDISYTIFNYGFHEQKNVIATQKSPLWYLKTLFNRKFSIFHFHQIYIFEFIYYFIFSITNATPILITIHAETLLNCGNIKRSLSLVFLRNTKKLKVISVSENLHKLLKSKNIDSIFLPAYVPPTEVFFSPIEKDDRVHFLFSVWKFTEGTANGSYNVPLAFRFLKKNQDRFKMVFMIGNKKDSDRKYLSNLLKEYNIEESVMVLFDKNLVDYVQNCSFLLRTNTADGYGVSLQEAMDLGVPAIATNVCTRPQGTVLFEDGNLNDLTEKINSIVKEDPQIFLNNKVELTDHLKLIELYKKYL